jgi:hypothetical protein
MHRKEEKNMYSSLIFFSVSSTHQLFVTVLTAAAVQPSRCNRGGHPCIHPIYFLLSPQVMKFAAGTPQKEMLTHFVTLWLTNLTGWKSPGEQNPHITHKS